MCVFLLVYFCPASYLAVLGKYCPPPRPILNYCAFRALRFLVDLLCFMFGQRLNIHGPEGFSRQRRRAKNMAAQERRLERMTKTKSKKEYS